MARCKETQQLRALKRMKMEKEQEGFPVTALRELTILKRMKVCIHAYMPSCARTSRQYLPAYERVTNACIPAYTRPCICALKNDFPPLPGTPPPSLAAPQHCQHGRSRSWHQTGVRFPGSRREREEKGRGRERERRKWERGTD